MSLSQALKLAQAELAGLSGRAKVQRMSQIARLFAAEVAGTVALAPFALKASQLHRSLRPPPPPDGACCEDPHSVHVVKNIHYGSRPRNTLDLYVPAAASRQRVPVVLFVHGGVWAAGDAWHYAPLAASLARLGVMAVVMQYTLYPDALVPQLVREVSAALDWALDNVGAYGGDARQVRRACLWPVCGVAHVCLLLRSDVCAARARHAVVVAHTAAGVARGPLSGCAAVHDGPAAARRCCARG